MLTLGSCSRVGPLTYRILRQAPFSRFYASAWSPRIARASVRWVSMVIGKAWVWTNDPDTGNEKSLPASRPLGRPAPLRQRTEMSRDYPRCCWKCEVNA